MSVSQISNAEIEPMRCGLRNRPLTVLLGAGASVPSGLPSWNEMVMKLLRATTLADRRGILLPADGDSGSAGAEGDVDWRVVAGKLVERNDLTLLAEAVRSAFADADAHAWRALLWQALYVGEGDDRVRLRYMPSAMHLSAAALAWRNPGSVRLATLNFDELLESALTATKDELGATAMPPQVEHLHGRIPESGGGDSRCPPIFSFLEYVDNLKDQNASAKRYLADSRANGPMLLAGTSFRDPDIRQWLMQDRNEYSHPMVVLVSRESQQVDLRTFEAMKFTLRASWNALGITPIFVNDYNDEAQLIREMLYWDRPGYVSPEQRARRLWDALIDEGSFAVFQQGFAKLLRCQKQQIKDCLSARSVNATLWVSHGRQLTRYATHDRVYLSHTLLRQSTVGYDSPYVAGAALGNNEIGSIRLEPGTSRWDTILAAPITVFPQSVAAYSPLPLAVVTFGVEGRVCADREAEIKALLGEVAGPWERWLGSIAANAGDGEAGIPTVGQHW